MLSKILNTHHAVLLEGDPEETILKVRSFFDEMDISFEGNPDVLFLSYQKFGIEDGRHIIELAQGAPVRNDHKIIVFSFGSITGEAQNAFLKIFEDPSPRLKFVVLTHSANSLLPTLKSRLHIIASGKRDVFDPKITKKFFEGSIKERMDQVEAFVKEYKDSGSKENIKQFLLGVHGVLEEKISQKTSSGDVEALEVVDRALTYLEDKSSSVKILLESVAIAL